MLQMRAAGEGYGSAMDAIFLNADTDLAVLIHGATRPWVPSPSLGVERKLLERAGGEVALATSIVRYAPGSRFSPHVHGAGEEFLVLEGTFSDEHGDYPPLTYVRNPPGSQHAPKSIGGCTIFVKLRQMSATEQRRVAVRARSEPGVQTLHRGSRVIVELHCLPPNGSLPLDARSGGEELFVFDGAARAPGVDLTRWSWWRRPPGAGATILTSTAGAVVWRKRGHLSRFEG
jgi:quercetin dioxygenase-like cupin family protein